MFQHLVTLVRTADINTRIAIEAALNKGLNGSLGVWLPLRYLALLACYAGESRKELNLMSRTHLLQCIIARRTFFKRAKKPEDLLVQQQLQFHFIPEYSVPFLVSILSHCADFSANEFRFPVRCLNVLLSSLMHQSNDYLFLEQLTNFMCTCEDARVPPSNKHFMQACEMAKRLVHKAADTKTWTDRGDYPGDIFLPPTLFKQLEGSKLSGLVNLDKQALAGSVPLPSLQEVKPVPVTPAKPKPTPTHQQQVSGAGSLSAKKKRASPSGLKQSKLNFTPTKKKPKKQEVEDDDEDEDEKEEEDEKEKKTAGPETPSRVLPSRGTKKPVTYSEKEEEEEEEKKITTPNKKRSSPSKQQEEEEEEEEKPSPPPTKKKGKISNKSKKEVERMEDPEEEEEEEPKPTHTRRTKKK